MEGSRQPAECALDVLFRRVCPDAKHVIVLHRARLSEWILDVVPVRVVKTPFNLYDKKVFSSLP